jgi:hypothetical protein
MNDITRTSNELFVLRAKAANLEADWSRCSQACAQMQAERDTWKATAQGMVEQIKQLQRAALEPATALPTWDECKQAVDQGGATPLQSFIYEYEPSLSPEVKALVDKCIPHSARRTDSQFRQMLAAAIVRADLPPCALLSHAKWLRQAAEEIRKEGHAGWGNTCEQAAEAIESATSTKFSSRTNE